MKRHVVTALRAQSVLNGPGFPITIEPIAVDAPVRAEGIRAQFDGENDVCYLIVKGQWYRHWETLTLAGHIPGTLEPTGFSKREDPLFVTVLVLSQWMTDWQNRLFPLGLTADRCVLDGAERDELTQKFKRGQRKLAGIHTYATERTKDILMRRVAEAAEGAWENLVARRKASQALDVLGQSVSMQE